MKKIGLYLAFLLACLSPILFDTLLLTALATDQTTVVPIGERLEIWPVNEASQPDESTLLLRYESMLGGLREDMTNPSLAIYRDGYVQVVYPAYMKQGGVYVGRLSPASLENLWRGLTHPRLLQFDQQKIRSEMHLLERNRSERPSMRQDKSDEVTATIEFYPNRWQARPALMPDGKFDEKKALSWYGLKTDAMRYTGIAEIQLLYEVCEQLDAIMQSDQLKKIP